MGRKKILVVTSTYPRWRGDYEPGFVHELSKRLAKNCDVTVLCPHACGALDNELLEGVTVRRYRYAPEKLETLVNDGGITSNLKHSPWKWLLVPAFFIAQLWALWRITKSEQPEVIHAHWLIPQGLTVTLLSFLERKTPPFIVTSHGADLFSLRSKPLEKMKKIIIEKASKITVVSRSMFEHLQRYDVKEGKVCIQPMGIDLTEKFTPDPTIIRSSDEILFVGRLVEKKGLNFLIDAMPSIINARPSTFLSIAGYGPEEESLRTQVTNLDLENHVNFLGAVDQDELPSLYRKAAVFVAPFVYSQDGDVEGLGLVVAEAIGCNCPVIVGDVPAVQDLFPRNSKLDNRVDPHNASDLKDKILYILNRGVTDNEMMEQRQWIVKKMDWNVVADGYWKLINQLFLPNN